MILKNCNILFVSLLFLDQCFRTMAFGPVKMLVVNGEPALLGDVPYQVSMKVRNGKVYGSFCGGTIIGPRKVLSAAHCFVQRKWFGGFRNIYSLDRLRVVAGNLLNRDSSPEQETVETGQWRLVTNITNPPHFNFPKHDIAILFVTTEWVFDTNVKSIGHAKKDDDYIGDKCQISGFGRTGTSRGGSDVLLRAFVHVKTQDECSRIHDRTMRRYICTDHSIADVHKGDSGGPLVCYKTGDPEEIEGLGVLVGIVSGSRGRDTFFLRVSTYYNWIKRNRAAVTCSISFPFIMMFACALSYVMSFLE